MTISIYTSARLPWLLIHSFSPSSVTSMGTVVYKQYYNAQDWQDDTVHQHLVIAFVRRYCPLSTRPPPRISYKPPRTILLLHAFLLSTVKANIPYCWPPFGSFTETSRRCRRFRILYRCLRLLYQHYSCAGTLQAHSCKKAGLTLKFRASFSKQWLWKSMMDLLKKIMESVDGEPGIGSNGMSRDKHDFAASGTLCAVTLLFVWKLLPDSTCLQSRQIFQLQLTVLVVAQLAFQKTLKCTIERKTRLSSKKNPVVIMFWWTAKVHTRSKTRYELMCNV